MRPLKYCRRGVSFPIVIKRIRIGLIVRTMATMRGGADFAQCRCTLSKMEFCMKQTLLVAMLVLATAAHAAVDVTPPVLVPLAQQAQAARLSAEILSRSHYKKVALDDAL